MLYLYAGIKAAFLIVLLKPFFKSEALQSRPLLMAGIYTAGIAFLSWLLLVEPQDVVMWRSWEMQLAKRVLPASQTGPALLGWRAWQLWLVGTLGLSWLYYWLLDRFDMGMLFWLILFGGLVLLFLF